jgi:hypothetical protein
MDASIEASALNNSTAPEDLASSTIAVTSNRAAAMFEGRSMGRQPSLFIRSRRAISAGVGGSIA